jgi:glycerophosphoryl diester phosphodiesterase
MHDAARRNRPLLLGHRGARARKSVPENTVASFDEALAGGCNGFEFDVRLAVDGAAVICHDPRFEGIEIASASAQQLKKLPLLEDVLARYRDRAFLDIELKVAGLETKIVELLRKNPPLCGFVVSSFLPMVLNVLHREGPEIPLGLICETRDELRIWNDVPANYIIPHHKLVDAALINQLKAAAKKIFVWTINDAAEMLRFRDLGIDGIISDDTRELCRTLG